MSDALSFMKMLQSCIMLRSMTTIVLHVMRPGTKIAILDNCKMDAIKKISSDVKLVNTIELCSNFNVIETASIRVDH